MKKFHILFLLFALCPAPHALCQQYGWTDLSANMPALGGFTDVHFIGNEGWIAGGNSEVFYTPDGGGTFQIQALPENSGITSSIFLKNNMEGYVVTFRGKIVKTENGGTNWTMLHEPGGVLNSVHFPPDSDTGYTCGSNGTVWAFDDVSITDISPNANVSNLQSICFPEDNSDGKVCGQTTIARYKNESWSNLQFYDCTLNYNSAGSEVLLHTIDGGTTWTQEIASQTVGKALMGVYFTSPNNGFVVGNNTVLKYGEITTGVEVEQELEDLAFEIYPNPAAGKFRVQSLKFKVEDAKIEIYDLNGRMLIEKILQAGNENTEIEVSHLKNGLYFCRLISEKYSATKKLIIQK